MKTIKSNILLTLFLCFAIHLSNAQQAFQVHQDNVKPSKVMQYEKIAKEFQAASVKHNLQTTWYAASSDDFKYYYITPIENFADLDKRPMADMAKAMGDDFGKMFAEFDKCYDTHGTYIMIRDSELSYMPEGVENAPEDEKYRKWIYMYYTPQNAKKAEEGMKAVKAMFKEKGSKEYYRVYRNGFGQMENYFMVSISAKDDIDLAQRGKANRALLGSFEERWETFSKLLNHLERMEEYGGETRPDLSYAPKTE